MYYKCTTFVVHCTTNVAFVAIVFYKLNNKLKLIFEQSAFPIPPSNHVTK